MEDPDYPVTLRLYYTVFYESDVISRYMEIENRGENPVTVEKCMPLHLDLPGCDYEMITLYGGHVWERQLQRVRCTTGARVYAPQGRFEPPVQSLLCALLSQSGS